MQCIIQVFHFWIKSGLYTKNQILSKVGAYGTRPSIARNQVHCHSITTKKTEPLIESTTSKCGEVTTKLWCIL